MWLIIIFSWNIKREIYVNSSILTVKSSIFTEPVSGKIYWPFNILEVAKFTPVIYEKAFLWPWCNGAHICYYIEQTWNCLNVRITPFARWLVYIYNPTICGKCSFVILNCDSQAFQPGPAVSAGMTVEMKAWLKQVSSFEASAYLVIRRKQTSASAKMIIIIWI